MFWLTRWERCGGAGVVPMLSELITYMRLREELDCAYCRGYHGRKRCGNVVRMRKYFGAGSDLGISLKRFEGDYRLRQSVHDDKRQEMLRRSVVMQPRGDTLVRRRARRGRWD